MSPLVVVLFVICFVLIAAFMGIQLLVNRELVSDRDSHAKLLIELQLKVARLEARK